MIAMCLRYQIAGGEKFELTGKPAERQAKAIVDLAHNTQSLKEHIEGVMAKISAAMSKHGIDDERQAARSALIRNELRQFYFPQFKL